MRVSRFRLYVAMRVMRQWNRLFRKVVDVPSLEVLKDRLERVLSNSILWKVSLPLAGELDDDL